MNPAEQLEGRPYGGCAILYKNTVQCKIEEIKCKSSRIVAILLIWENFTILLINVYMPCDTGSLNSEYTEILNEINEICIESDTNHIILGETLILNLLEIMINQKH